jgi:Amt family ammonium transporter
MTRKTTLLTVGALTSVALTAAAPAHAEVSAETAYTLNTFSFLIHGALVFFMAVGFAMLEAGLVRSKNVASICLKNTALYATASIAFYLLGYNLMYTDVSGWIGSFAFLYNPSGAETTLIGADEATVEMVTAVTDNGYSVMSDWFFQVVFVATAASVVSGTVAERMKVWPFIAFVFVLGAVIYPIQGSWTWGGGWLTEMGFSDFAGSTIVHSVGGWAALAGAIMVGARKGKYGKGGRVNPLPGSNLSLATLGMFILWFGWFGFNGGSQLALGSALDATAMSIVYANTFLAACAGIVTAMAMTQFVYKKIDLTMVLNGALAGLVAITANPTLENLFLAMVVGAIGAVLAVLAVPLLDKLKIDDVVGAISVHLVGGIWGTLAVGIFGGGDLIAQIVGIVAVGAYTLLASFILWGVLKATVGLRVSDEEEMDGLDKHELGLEAYPEFGRGSQS